jgi:hypothetical protein
VNGKIKLWVGLSAGASLFAGVSTASAAPVLHSRLAAAPMTVLAAGKQGGEGGEAAQHKEHRGEAARQGGEGGEGGEGGGKAEPFGDAEPDERLVGMLLLMKGHLLVADELLLRGDLKGAAPHMKHPRAEIYEKVEDDLEQAGLDGLEEKLEAVEHAAGGSDPKVAGDATQAAIAEIGAAVNRIVERKRDDADFVFEVVVGVLRAADQENREALEDKRFRNVVEYQDGRGFVAAADDFLVRFGRALAGKDAQAYERIGKELGEMKLAWPTPTPPERPAVTTSQLASSVSRIELLGGHFR